MTPFNAQLSIGHLYCPLKGPETIIEEAEKETQELEERRNNRECCSPRLDRAIVSLNSQHLCLPTQDLYMIGSDNSVSKREEGLPQPRPLLSN